MAHRPHHRFLLALALGALAPGPALAGGHVLSVFGAVEMAHGSETVWRTAKAGDALESGDRVRTGAAARAELDLGDGRLVRLYEQSLLRVGARQGSGGPVQEVELDRGESLFDVMKRITGDEFRVRTPEIVVSVKGTRFLVASEAGADHASVFRGVVGVEGGGFDELSLRAGFTALDGEVHVTPFSDPWQAWESSASAPTLALDASLDDDVARAIDAAATHADKAESEPAPPAKPIEVEDSSKDRDEGGIEIQVDPGAVVEPVLDPVNDIGRESSSVLLDAVLGADRDDFGDSSGSGSGSTDVGPLTVDVTTSGGPNTVTVGFGTDSVQLDQTQVDAILQGDTSSLGTFNEVLDRLDVDPQELARKLDNLL
jgi:hypothetical protein